MLYMVTFTINIPQMLAYIPYMDPINGVISVTAPMVFSEAEVPRLKRTSSPSA